REKTAHRSDGLAEPRELQKTRSAFGNTAHGRKRNGGRIDRRDVAQFENRPVRKLIQRIKLRQKINCPLTSRNKTLIEIAPVIDQLVQRTAQLLRHTFKRHRIFPKLRKKPQLLLELQL